MTELLWPASTVTSSRSLSPRSGPAGYVIIPSAARPTLVVPRRPLRVASAAVRNYNTASVAKRRATAVALSAAMRVGLGDLLPARVNVGADPDIRTHLSQVLGRPVDVALYIGPARAVRKPVLQVLERDGTTSAFAKLGVDDFTRALVHDEAVAVGLLAGARLRVLAVPELLHHGRWDGHELLVQSAIGRGTPAPPGDPLLGRAMDELARAGKVRASALADSSYWRRLTDRLAGLPVGPITEELTRSLATLRTRRPDTVVEFGSWHGDWTPWNMTVSSGRVCVWDWEKFELDTPIGFDAIHYTVQATVASTGASPRTAFDDVLSRVAEVLTVHQISGPDAAIVFWLYVLELGVRYVADGEPAAGTTAMSRVHDWLGPVLAGVERVAAERVA